MADGDQQGPVAWTDPGTTTPEEGPLAHVFLDNRLPLSSLDLVHGFLLFPWPRTSWPTFRRLDATMGEDGASPPRAGATSPPERRIVAEVEARPRQVLLLGLSNQQTLTLRQGGRPLATEPPLTRRAVDHSTEAGGTPSPIPS
jgi:hypothetical protein